MPDADAPPVLAELISNCGIEVGTMIADTAGTVAERINTTISAAFAHGVAEGMEIAAQLCGAAVPLLAADYSVAHAGAAQMLRDQIRMGALMIEIPS